jgi:TPR repeat protein
MSDADIIRALKRLLTRSDARVIQAAQVNLGTCYEDGTGVAKDAAEAVRLYRLAADQGHAGAQYNLGACYEKGLGVVKDTAEAVRWLVRAADQGHPLAQYNAGAHYMTGDGVAHDKAEAARWIRLAAGQGDEQALKLLPTLEELLSLTTQYPELGNLFQTLL